MRNILRQSNRRVVQRFARSNVLLAFDFDGTLAPITAFPERAHPRPATARLLSELTGLYPCVVISGRARADVVERLGGIPVHGVIGNHGIEPRGASEVMIEEIERWRPLLERRLSSLRGVSIEDKVFSIAVHYRHAPDRKGARAAIMEAAGKLGDARVTGGILVVNILPEGAPHKGTALEAERQRLGCDTAIYVGDDETDEDVFALNQPERFLTIRVGASRESAASYCLRDQAEVDALLQVLVLARQRSELPIMPS